MPSATSWIPSSVHKAMIDRTSFCLTGERSMPRTSDMSTLTTSGSRCAKLVSPAYPAPRRLEEIERAAQVRFVRSEQRLVREGVLSRPRHDRLRRDPQLLDRGRELRLQPRPIADRFAFQLVDQGGLAPHPGQLVNGD